MKDSYKTILGLFSVLLITGLLITGLAWLGAGDEPKLKTDFLNKSMPTFTLSDIDGNEFSTDQLKGKKTLFFFNEGLVCYPACWDEMKALSADKRFEEKGVQVYSVVADEKESWKQAIEKMPELSKIDPLFDENGNLSRTLGLLDAPSSMHKGKLPGHTYVLVDEEGVIRYMYDDPTMAKNADGLLAEVNKL